jgi:hypothetical protein
MAISHIQQIAKTQPTPSSVLILNRPGKMIETQLQPNKYDELGSYGNYQLLRVSKQALVNN